MTRIFEFVDAAGNEVPDSETQGFHFGDFFDCDIYEARDDELAAAYKGADCDGVGVRWITA